MAPELNFRGQPFDEDLTTAAGLRSMLSDSEIDSVTIVVAWARFRGLRRLKPELEAFRARGGRLRIILGIDEGGATRPGLALAAALFHEAHVFHDSQGGTFHPKLYLAQRARRARLIVGSSNATPGGLFSNYEASLEAVFDLASESESAALRGARDYLERLLAEDQLCKVLTEELINELVESPHYDVAGHERARRRGRGGEPSGDPDLDTSGSAEEKPDALFGDRHAQLVSPPPLPPEALRELTDLERVEPEEEIEKVIEAASDSEPAVPEVVASWRKELPASDAQHPPSGSATRNLRLTEAGNNINWRTFFREELFGPATWRDDVDIHGHDIERATIAMAVTVYGHPLGTFDLKVTHAPHRESGQHNHTTVLHWGPLMPRLRADDYTGHVVTLRRLDNGTYTLDISA